MSRHKRRSDTSGLSSSGEARGLLLFTGRSLQTALAESCNKARDQAIRRAMASYKPPSRLHLRRVAVDAATWTASLVLHAPRPGGTIRRYGWQETSCIVPFSGNGQLFHASVRGLPLPRPLRGTIDESTLTLCIAYDAEDEPMAWPLLASELATIREQIVAQRKVVEAYNRALPSAMRAYVDANYEWLMSHRETIIAQVRAQERVEQDRRIAEMRSVLGV